MKYEELIIELYSRRTKGIKLGLERMNSVLQKLNNPHLSYPSIHIAGTNGKGSVSKIIYSLLKAHGFNVGLFTSPHLTRFTERIVVNDIEISEEDVIRLIQKIKPLSEELTFFECVTLMAFIYFKEKGVDYAVLETGMGGRLDATNVVNPLVSVITKIGYDHQEFLGSTLREIAREKAGIIKKGIPVISASQEKEAEEEILKTSEESHSSNYIYGRDFKGELNSISLYGIDFDFYPSHEAEVLSNLELSLTGIHQLENASIALKAFMTAYPGWNESSIRAALKSVKMPGRLEVISENPLIVFDIAHNPQAAEALVNSLRILTEKKPILVFGVMKDKDVKNILKSFENYAEKILFTSPKYERAITYEEVCERLNGFSKKINPKKDTLTAFKEALFLCKENPALFILCTGSAYLIGEIKEFLGERTLHRTLGELL